MSEPTPTAPGGLTAKQWAAILSLVGGSTHQEAAKAAGVHANRIGEWMQLEPFRDALYQAQRQALDQLVRALLAQGRASIETITTLRDDAKAPAAVRLRAADALLGRLLALAEYADLERRVAELEAATHAQS